MVARLHGRGRPLSFILKYESSNNIDTHAAALDANLATLWQIHRRPTAMGHHATVADLNGDGRDDVIFGELAVDSAGKTLFEHRFGRHADMTDVFDADDGGKRILVSICQTGPAYCLEPNGRIVWQKTRKEVPHGQAIWAGDFLPDRPGLEAIILCSGHVGQFMTVDATTGKTLARFHHSRDVRAYPDMPVTVRWPAAETTSLWIPADRRLADGRGQTVCDFAAFDKLIDGKLHAGTNKRNIAAQAVAVDLCGDGREEIILYHPYRGEAILIFTQPDSDAKAKPYVHRPGVCNRKSCF
jgi:hypothetical protein